MKSHTYSRRILSAGCVITLATLAYAQANACWTVTGVTGAVETASQNLVQVSGDDIRIRPNLATGTANIRYPILPVAGIFGGERRTKTLTLRYADNGPGARVVAKVRRLNLATGQFEDLVTFDSNTLPQQTTAQFLGVPFNCDKPEFDFKQFAYTVEVQLIKSAAGGTPLIRALRLCGDGIC